MSWSLLRRSGVHYIIKYIQSKKTESHFAPDVDDSWLPEQLLTFFLICKENNKMHINSPERSLPTVNFSSIVIFVCPYVLCKRETKKAEGGKQKEEWNSEAAEERCQKTRMPKEVRLCLTMYTYRLWKPCRLSSFLVACQAWPPVSHPGSQMTALILLGSAPNQHFAH